MGITLANGIGCEPLDASAGQARAAWTAVSDAQWLEAAQAARRGGGRLVSLWGKDGGGERLAVCAAYAFGGELLWVELPIDGASREGGESGEGGGSGEDGSSGASAASAAGGDYPDLVPIFPYAARMQRAVFELVGLRARGAQDTRAWLNHGHWPADYHPLRSGASGTERFALPQADYPFVQVAGDGVHEIAVGPIHAGVIEPGHFRFSVVGEKVLRLEERLGYAHRGIEKLFERTPARLGHRLAGRIAGDSTVAFAWAYCMALEQALRIAVPERALRMRGLYLERERVANHLGDLGALGNDAGFGFGLAQFSRMREDWLRLNDDVFGHRLLMDRIVPGGVALDLSAGDAAAIVAQCARIENDVHRLRRIYDDQSGVQDRFAGTGRLSPEVAAHFGVSGLAARASGGRGDVRADARLAPYDAPPVPVASDARGDVAARVAVRFAEIDASLQLIRAWLADLPSGPLVAGEQALAAPAAGRGVGWIEGWRGDVFVALETSSGGALARCHCHDPSWRNWPALEHAIIGNIVPDFPLINKSFNLNYAGHDL